MRPFSSMLKLTGFINCGSAAKRSILRSGASWKFFIASSAGLSVECWAKELCVNSDSVKTARPQRLAILENAQRGIGTTIKGSGADSSGGIRPIGKPSQPESGPPEQPSNLVSDES